MFDHKTTSGYPVIVKLYLSLYSNSLFNLYLWERESWHYNHSVLDRLNAQLYAEDLANEDKDIK